MDGVLETLGIVTFSWRGQLYKLARPNLEAEGFIRAYLQHRERVWMQRQAEYDHPDFPGGKMTPQEYARHLEGWRESCVAGKWAFKKPNWYAAMDDPECFTEMIYLCLHQLGEQVAITRADARAMVQEKQAECDQRRGEALKAGMEIAEVYQTIRSELVEAFDSLLAPTPSIPPQAAGESR